MTGTTSMLGQPAGWFRDPAPRDPAFPDTLRYWDGNNWTGQVKMASRRQRQEWLDAAAVERHTRAQQVIAAANAGDVEAQQLLTAARSAGARASTPDGQETAGWWIRAAAMLIDNFLINVLWAIFGWRWLMRITDEFTAFIDQSVRAGQAGRQGPDPAVLMDELLPLFAALAVTYLVISFFYEVGFLKGFQATPGKMLLKLQVRLRAEPGPLPWGAVLLRWLGKRGSSVLEMLPLGVLLYAGYSTLNYLWPLWDKKRQALHDKLAGTNVVRR